MNNTTNQHLSYESYFDGGLADYIGYSIVAWAIAFFTLGICTPWSICIMQSWKAKHTIINGHRLQFTGSAIGLFGHWIKWFFLTIITFGIYSFWLNIKMQQWITKNTHFIN